MPEMDDTTFAEVELAKKHGPFAAWCAWGTDFGGGKGQLLGFFTEESDARMVAKAKNRGPGDGSVEEVSCVRIGRHVYLLTSPLPIALDEGVEESRQELRARAISKLTSAELAALGVKT